MTTATISQKPAPLVARAAWHEHLFFSVVACLVLIGVFVGFARTYFLAGFFRAKLPSLMVHIHGALFTLWIALLVAQVALVARGHREWHMRLGKVGMFIAPLMLITGFATLIGAIKRRFVPPTVLQSIVSADTMILCFFAFLILWAFCARHDAATHKRLILFATFLIIAPAIGRLAFGHSPFWFYLPLNTCPALLVTYDIWSRRALHRATIAGVSAIVLLQVLQPVLAQSTLMIRIIAHLQRG